jgi:hypothetical protein
MLASAVLPADAQTSGFPVTSTWTGGTGYWSDPANWGNPPGVPAMGYQVLIDTGNPILDVSAPALNNIGIGSGGALTVNSSLPAGSLISFGGLTINANGILNSNAIGFVQDTATARTYINAGGRFLDAGSYSQANGLTFVNGILQTPLFHVTGGAVTTGASGVLAVGAGGFAQDGSVTTTVSKGGQMTVTGAYAQGNGSTSVFGSLGAGLFSIEGGTMYVAGGGSVIAGTGGYAQGTEHAPGTSTTIASGGQLTVTGGDYGQEIGTSTIVNGTLTADAVNNSGTFSGDGAIWGQFEDPGYLNPGQDSTGVLSIFGNYTQTGFLDAGFSGINSGDFLAIHGTAGLGGTLDVSFDNGFVPVGGDVFNVMSFTSSTGSFYDIASQNLPTGESLEALYGPNGVSVEVVGTPEPPIITPEPHYGLVMGLGLAALGLILRLQIRRQLRTAHL